eukprot:11617881-Alexandrium_andersonii.AAC.1
MPREIASSVRENPPRSAHACTTLHYSDLFGRVHLRCTLLRNTPTSMRASIFARGAAPAGKPEE